MKKARKRSGYATMAKAAAIRIPVPSVTGAGWRVRGPGGSMTGNTPSAYPTLAKRPGGRRVVPQPPDGVTVPWSRSGAAY